MAYSNLVNGIYQSYQAIPTNTLVIPSEYTQCYWKLSGDYQDYSGNNRHLIPTTFSGITNITQGKYGNAVHFLPQTMALNTTPFLHSGYTVPSSYTASFWIKLDSNYATNTEFRFIFSIGVMGANGAQFGISNGKHFRGVCASVGWMSEVTDIELSSNDWNNCIVTYDGGNNKYLYYVNGIKSSIEDTYNQKTPEAVISIGAVDSNFYGGYESRDESICEVIVENRIWTAQDVKNYYFNL